MTQPARASAAELRDIAELFALHERRLDQGDAKLHEHDRSFAEVYQELTTLRNEIIILRDGVSEYCNRTAAKFDAALKKLRLDADTG